MSASKIIKVNATRSTNDKVKMLIKSKKILSGDLIIAKYQYGGRGQRMNKWYSSYGKNLLCSLFYRPLDINADRTFLINQVVSLAVLKTIRKFNNEKCLIKWPNDILSVNKKIAGILVENSLSSDKVNYSIIGVYLLFVIFPIIWIALLSLKNEVQAFANPPLFIFKLNKIEDA